MELPIFPLPNVVFFPYTLLPLHIFESRYKQMVSEALQGKRRIAMALLQPGWEANYYGSPDIYQIGGMGQISAVRRLKDGEYDLQLHGLSRYQIIEVLQQTPYRIARVQLLEDRVPSQKDTVTLSAALLSCVKAAGRPLPSPVLDRTLLEKLDFPALVNSLCSSAALSVYEKQSLLEVGDLKKRAKGILAFLKKWLSQEQLITPFRHLAPEDPRVN